MCRHATFSTLAKQQQNPAVWFWNTLTLLYHLWRVPYPGISAVKALLPHLLYDALAVPWTVFLASGCQHKFRVFHSQWATWARLSGPWRREPLQENPRHYELAVCRTAKGRGVCETLLFVTSVGHADIFTGWGRESQQSFVALKVFHWIDFPFLAGKSLATWKHLHAYCMFFAEGVLGNFVAFTVHNWAALLYMFFVLTSYNLLQNTKHHSVQQWVSTEGAGISAGWWTVVPDCDVGRYLPAVKLQTIFLTFCLCK